MYASLQKQESDPNRSITNMTLSDTNELIKKLISEQQRLKTEITLLQSKLKTPTKTEYTGERSVLKLCLKTAMIKHKDILTAIRNIENKIYGICQDCGCEISQKRLNAKSTSLCVFCATAREQEQKQPESLFLHPEY